MYEKIPTAALTREEWLRLRKTGIGGSDAGALCGLNPFSSPMKVYQDKTSEDIDTVDNEAMRQGRELEEYVARRFMEATGKKVRRSNVMYRSLEHPFMIADVDRLIVGEDAGLECKTASAFQAEKWKDGQVPAHYLIQCLHYMAVTGKKEWYLAVVIWGREFKFQRIPWKEEMIQNLIQIEEQFWKGNVMSHILPEPDGTEACEEVIKKYFGSARKGSTIPLVGFDGKLKRYEELEKRLKEAEAEQKKIEQEIKLYMQDNEQAFCDGFQVSWASVDSSRLDTKKLKEEQPETYRQFLKTSSTRRFQIKAA